MTALHDFTTTTLSGEDQDLSEYAGKVVVVVNTASKCGLTPQYAGLQLLYDTYADRGLVILGFPCNQFANQEPGTSDDVAAFCTENYGVTFPMFEKVDVNGTDAPLPFKWLRSQKGGVLGRSIKWSFTKFLVDRDGIVLERYAPATAPASLAKDVKAALGPA